MILSKNFPFTKLFSRLKQLHVLRFGHRLNPTFPFFILNRFPLKLVLGKNRLITKEKLILCWFSSLSMACVSGRRPKRRDKGKNGRAQSDGKSRGRIDHFTPLLRPATQAGLSMLIRVASPNGTIISITLQRRSAGSNILFVDFWCNDS